MRPYFALIKDSFRAAIASNVLYVVLGIITLLLLAIAPIHVKEILDWQIKFGNNVAKPDQLAKRLVEQGEDPDKPAVRRVWELLDDGLKDDMKKYVAFQEDETVMPDGNQRVLHEHRMNGELQDELNEIIKRRDFYQAEAWASKRLNSEARELLDEGIENLGEERSKRLNRLLMASALPGLVQRGSGSALELWYATWRWEDMTFNVSHSEFAAGTISTVTWVFDKFVLSVGIFIAILVTANFIPETFLPGSLNLLLSKPISRWGLLLAKFAGGCAFVSLCAVYLFFGTWLWLGFGMNIWDRGILWGIPLYIIVFAIYYSVSTLVGVWSRSPILSIIVTAIFWVACFSVGLSYQMFSNRLDNSKTQALVSVPNNLLHVGEMNTISRWDDKQKNWEDELEIKMAQEQKVAIGFALFAPGAGGDEDLSSLGPVYDPKHKRILAGMVDLTNPTTMNHQDLYTSPADEIKFERIGKIPQGTLVMFSDPDGVITVEGNGTIRRFVGGPNDEKEPADKIESMDTGSSVEKTSELKSDDKKNSGIGGLMGSLLSNKKKKVELFRKIGPESVSVPIRHRQNATYNPVTRDILLYRNAKVSQFTLNKNGKYDLVAEKEIATGVRPEMRAIVSASGDTVVIALGTGKVITLDADSLETKNSYLPQKASPFRDVKASSNGQYFVFRCRNNTAWMLDTQQPETIEKLNVAGQGDIAALQFDYQNHLWVAGQSNSACQYDLGTGDRIQSLAPPTGTMTKIFHYFLAPLYTIFPKPGEFYKVVAHLSAKPDEAEEMNVDLQTLSDAKDPWQPLWIGLLFMCSMLLITALIFQFRDF